MHVGIIMSMSIPGDIMSTPWPGDFGTNEKKPLPNFQVTSHKIFVSFKFEVDNS